ncbi:hypothetical protein K1719_003712 [Acacia pycnantha]|nr:hypothetical protein K1719_003712 [Acacia pycnantha]
MNFEGEGKRLCSSGPFWVFRLISARIAIIWVLQMDGYIVIVYHFGGLLLRNNDGIVEYINGRVDELTEVDADYVNLKDLESIFKGYGYEKCDRMMWLKPGEPDLEHGLQPLCLDSDIALANGNRIHIYFDHCIAGPDIISLAEEDHRMFSPEEESDSYESVEDEAYKPPPTGVEDLSEEYYKAQDDEAQDDEAEDDEEQCRPKNKKPARQSNDDSNEDVSEEENLVHEEEANEEEANDSFDENGYEYDSEELKTPRSSDDEGHDSEKLPQFNEKAEFGHVYFELGM